MENPIRFSLSEKVFELNNLTLIEKLILEKIIFLIKQKNICYASNNYFSELFGVHIRTIKRSLKTLKLENLIEIDEINHSCNSQRFIKINYEKLGVTKCHPHGQNVTHNIEKRIILYKYNINENPSDFHTDYLYYIWNKIPESIKHNYYDCSLSTYKYIKKYLKQLKMGKFFKNWKINNEFLKKYNIDIDKYKNYKFTFEEIKASVNNYKKLMEGNYGIDMNGKYIFMNKIYASEMPKSLLMFLFNHVTKKSWFLVCHAKCIKHRNEMIIIPDKYSDIYYKLEKAIDDNFKPLDSFLKRDLIKATKDLCQEKERLEKLQRYSRGDVFGYFHDSDTFYQNYVDWLHFFYDSKIPISPKMIGIHSNNWPFYLAKLAENNIQIK